MKARYRIIGISILVVLLVLIRMFEGILFYDPLIEYFHSDYHHNLLPEYDFSKLIMSMSLRFWLNSAISLLILYVGFVEYNIAKFASVLYIILYVVGFIVFSILLYNLENMDYIYLFYVRRFLIHPMFVIILLPAFYYYRLKEYRKAGMI